MAYTNFERTIKITILRGTFYLESSKKDQTYGWSLTKSYILKLTKCEHKGVSKSIDPDDRNFSSLKPEQIFNFF